MSPLSLWLAAVCVLSIWTVEYAAGCDEQQYEHDGRCCDPCPAGKYVKEFCSDSQQTECIPCEEGFYLNQSNAFDRCEECTSCRQEYADKCTPTTNAHCLCRSGFLCSSSLCTSCVVNKCVTGEKATRTEHPLSGDLVEFSYQCQPLCSDEAYFDIKENVCKPRRQCSVFGLAEIFPGNKTHNSVCVGDAERHSNGGDFQVVLCISFALLSITVLVLISYAGIKALKKHKHYNNPVEIRAVSTHVVDFHLSKEESEPQLLIQDESKSKDSLDQLHLEKGYPF